jgi:hypothetical protein
MSPLNGLDDVPLQGALPGPSEPGEGSLVLDLLRADLYRLLDEVARAAAANQDGLVLEFERAWETFKEACARRP